jgi:uncharacterized repeat protein (TIGR03803 family)
MISTFTHNPFEDTMKTPKASSRIFAFVLLTLTLCLIAAPVSEAAADRVLHTFGGASSYPSSGLVSDGAGNYYGVTEGAVYELSLAAGVWSYRTIQVLPAGRADFAGGNLVRDTAGNLYGSTWQGGSSGCGFIFELSPASSGSWTYSTLYNFNCTQGDHAGHTMVMDTGGNLYGVGQGGGVNDYGVAYELSPASGGGWTYTVLYNFTLAEGGGPQIGLVADASGNLYGANGYEIFELSPNGDGTWTESAAHVFTAEEGSNPLGDLSFDSAGNLYGTNQAGGKYEAGTAFKLTPNESGGWTSTILHSFVPKSPAGASPEGALSIDSAGNVYGTALATNGASGYGVVFKLAFVSGVWSEHVLHTFGGTPANDGSLPEFSLYLDNAGYIFGVTAGGGSSACSTNGCGTVYEVSQ